MSLPCIIHIIPDKEVAEERTTDTNSEKWQQIDTVMVVDDDDNWCFISKKILRKAGFQNQIITATNGQEALKKLQEIAAHGEKMPELIFLDIKMPVMDGFTFLDEITGSPELDLSQTQIFICSSSFLPKDKERAKLYPVAGFITKPLTLETLNEIIE